MPPPTLKTGREKTEVDGGDDGDDDTETTGERTMAEQNGRRSTSSPPESEVEGTYDPDAPELDPDLASYDANEGLPQFPITHELPLKDHNKVISAMAMDPSGARLVTGSHDYDCKLWDFGGMDSRCKPFRSWEPAGSYYVSSKC